MVPYALPLTSSSPSTTLTSASSSASSDPPPASPARPDSNLPPSLWLPLLSIALVCVMFVSFRRAGASGIVRGEDALVKRVWAECVPFPSLPSFLDSQGGALVKGR